jgi:tetratricopeptide (TPR) repeat protein
VSGKKRRYGIETALANCSRAEAGTEATSNLILNGELLQVLGARSCSLSLFGFLSPLHFRRLQKTRILLVFPEDFANGPLAESGFFFCVPSIDQQLEGESPCAEVLGDQYPYRDLTEPSPSLGHFDKIGFMDRVVKPVLAILFLGLCLPISSPARQDQTSTSESRAQKDRDSAREAEESSSKDTRIDLAPPPDDAKKHPLSGAAVTDAQDSGNDVQEFRRWDPHKASKDIEVGDFYYKRKNYRAALARYKEALVYKPNDAVANFRLAECQEKTGDMQEAVAHYEAYLKILPHGPLAGDAQKALERLNTGPTKELGAK